MPATYAADEEDGVQLEPEDRAWRASLTHSRNIQMQRALQLEFRARLAHETAEIQLELV